MLFHLKSGLSYSTSPSADKCKIKFFHKNISIVSVLALYLVLLAIDFCFAEIVAQQVILIAEHDASKILYITDPQLYIICVSTYIPNTNINCDKIGGVCNIKFVIISIFLFLVDILIIKFIFIYIGLKSFSQGKFTKGASFCNHLQIYDAIG
jgi:hypothetical protein